MAEPLLYTCNMCSYGARDLESLTSHVCRSHKNDSRFHIYCESCLRSYTKWDSYRKHVQRGCSIMPSSMVVDPITSAPSSSVFTDEHDREVFDVMETDDHQPDAVISQKDWHEATYVLNIKEKYVLSQVAVDQVLSSTKTLVSDILSQLLDDVRSSVPAATMQLLDNKAFQISSALFSRISSASMQKKYFKQHFNLIEPVSIELGRTRKWKKKRVGHRVVTVIDTFQYIPLLDSLKCMLGKSDVMEQVITSHTSEDPVFRDFCDGSYVRNHNTIKRTDLLISFYFDELEVANPLGSKRGKHKLGVFYWMLLNVHPAYRSSLHFIQLLAVVKSSHLKAYGIDAIMKPAINDLLKLANYGIEVDYNGIPQQFRGYLVTFFGDTPAAGLVGGFKEGVGGAIRGCRNCFVKKKELCSKLKCSQLRLRSLEKHKLYCTLLNQDLRLVDHFSSMFGINRLSILDELPYFDLTLCLPHDIMHVLLEGVLPRNCRLLLRHCIVEKKYFTINHLNKIMLGFQYGEHEKFNAPRPLDRDRITGDSDKLGQSASQMWLLSRLLPLMVGDCVPEDDSHWICYINILRILCIATAFEITQDAVAVLQMLIEDYLRQFNALYPGTITPKMHYLLHLPRQIQLFGPLRHQWCMRLEAKNHYLKRLVGLNFKNVPKSVAVRHQYNNYVFGLIGPTFLYKGDVIGRVEPLVVQLLPHGAKVAVQERFPEDARLPSAQSVSVLGQEFRPGVCVCLQPPCDSDYPKFAQVTHILVPEDLKMLLLRTFITNSYSQHHNAYCVTMSSRYVIAQVDELALHDIFTVYTLSSISYVVIRSCCHTDFLV